MLNRCNNRFLQDIPCKQQPQWLISSTLISLIVSAIIYHEFLATAIINGVLTCAVVRNYTLPFAALYFLSTCTSVRTVYNIFESCRFILFEIYLLL